MVLQPTRFIKVRRLFHVFALRRSGHHSIISWLRATLKQPTERINDCSVPHVISRRSIRNLSADRPNYFEAVVMNYEDRPLEDIANVLNSGRQLVEGIEADETTYVIVLRDIFNNMASKARANPERGRAYLSQEVEKWKSYAKEYLGLTSFLPSTIRVSFNDWFERPEYRDDLAVALRCDFSGTCPNAEEAMQSVPRIGQSQFDGRDFHGRAQEMTVARRWRQQLDDPRFVRLFQDRDAVDLSKRIFNVEGIGELLEMVKARP